MLSIERIDDEERFAGLAGEWDALLADTDADNVFLTWEWLHTWWRHLAGRRRLFRASRVVLSSLLPVLPRVMREFPPARSADRRVSRLAAA